MSVAIVLEVSSQVLRADVPCQAGYQEGRVFSRTPLNDYRHRSVVRDINTGRQFNSTVLYDCFDFSAHGAANYPRSRALRQRTCSTPRALRKKHAAVAFCFDRIDIEVRGLSAVESFLNIFAKPFKFDLL